SVLASELGDWRGGRAENSNVERRLGGCLLESIGHVERVRADCRFVLAAENHASETAERRDLHRLAIAHLVGNEPQIIVFACATNRGLAGARALYEDTTASRTAAGSAGNLGDELERPFARPQVGL